MKLRNSLAACVILVLLKVVISEDVNITIPLHMNENQNQTTEIFQISENTSHSINGNQSDESLQSQFISGTDATVYGKSIKTIIVSTRLDTSTTLNTTTPVERFSEATSPVNFVEREISTVTDEQTTTETSNISQKPVFITSTESSTHSTVTDTIDSSPFVPSSSISTTTSRKMTTEEVHSSTHATISSSNVVQSSTDATTSLSYLESKSIPEATRDEIRTTFPIRRRTTTSKPSTSSSPPTTVGITKLFPRKPTSSTFTTRSDKESSPAPSSSPVTSSTMIPSVPPTLTMISGRISSSTMIPYRTSPTISAAATTPAPTEDRYFVVIKSDDCPTLKANKFDRELSKALSALGVLNVTADISQTECQTKLNVNITATAPYSAIKLLEDSKKHNLTITIFNRTFKVVDIQKLDHASKSSISGSTPNVINAVTNQEFNTYIAVGVCFGVVFIVCLSVCCIKCWINGPSKKLRALRRTHTPLSPEDYTLTPLPRPTSLYVDYCRNSFTGDVCSTTSAGSVASTSPIVEKGVVQPFETCIVPLEDTTIPNLASASQRRDSVESARSRDNPNIHTVSGPSVSPDVPNTREVFNTRPYVCNYQRPGGLSNPSYRRY